MCMEHHIPTWILVWGHKTKRDETISPTIPKVVLTTEWFLDFYTNIFWPFFAYIPVYFRELLFLKWFFRRFWRKNRAASGRQQSDCWLNNSSSHSGRRKAALVLSLSEWQMVMTKSNFLVRLLLLCHNTRCTVHQKGALQFSTNICLLIKIFSALNNHLFVTTGQHLPRNCCFAAKYTT